MEAAAAHLLNFSAPFDCALLDQVVLIAMDGAHPQRAAASEFLVKMKDHPDMWRRVGKVIALGGIGADEPASKAPGHSTFLARLNLVLVQILQQDWPHSWPSFIGDIVGSSKTSEALCENNMKVG
jgi:exportin-1